MDNHIAFLNAWGSNELEFGKKKQTRKAVSTHFIVTALTASKEHIPEIERVLAAVRQRHFDDRALQAGPLHKKPDLLRLVLEDILEAPFQIFALVVDKKQVIREGLQYKGSFYKFLHGLADRELFSLFPNLEMVAGPAESESFMEGFVRYVGQNHISNLFNQSSFGFVSQPNELVSQAAGFIGEVLARCYDETLAATQRQELVQLLSPKFVTLKFWPDVLEPSVLKSGTDELLYDPKLAELSMNLANDFIQSKVHSPAPHVMDQVTTLNYLLFHFRHINAVRYISSFEVIEHIKARRGKAVSLHYFQTKVIAPLRDAGMLIASSSKGYKLPASESDLYDFVNHSNAIIEPMLSRIRKFRDQIRFATDGSLDILDKAEYSQIRKVVE